MAPELGMIGQEVIALAEIVLVKIGREETPLAKTAQGEIPQEKRSQLEETQGN